MPNLFILYVYYLNSSAFHLPRSIPPCLRRGSPRPSFAFHFLGFICRLWSPGRGSTRLGSINGASFGAGASRSWVAGVAAGPGNSRKEIVKPFELPAVPNNFELIIVSIYLANSRRSVVAGTRLALGVLVGVGFCVGGWCRDVPRSSFPFFPRSVLQI